MTKNPVASVLWPDADLLSVTVLYDQVEIQVRETTGAMVTVKALGHIGFSLVGFWDETVIEAVDLVDAHPFGEQCSSSIGQRLGDPRPSSGSDDRNSGAATTLVMTLADGAQILVAAVAFEVDRQ